MNRKEYIEHLRSLIKTDRELANALADEYHADSMATLDQLTARAEAKLGRAKGRIAMADGKVASGLPEAFGVSEAHLRRIIDPNSKENWMTLPSKEIQRAAIRAGYMKDLPNNASEAQKAENRKGLKDFLDLLSAETVSQGRRNAVNEYENMRFSEHPVDWTRKAINDLFFRTTSNRMKEQALRGKGPSGFGQMGVGDWGALGGDIGVNAMYGAGAAGIGRGLAARAPLGIRSTRDILMGPAIAGGAAGTLDAVNRGINTENGTRWYEYPSEAVLGAVSNVVAEPRVIRGAIRGATGVLKGGKVGGQSSREALGRGQRLADDLTGTTEAQLREIVDGMATPNPTNSPMTAETRKKVDKMIEILDEGRTPTRGEEASLFEQAQAMYEKSQYRPLFSEVFGEKSSPGHNAYAFARDIDEKIAGLEAVLKDNAGPIELKSMGFKDAEAAQRQLDYFKNLKEMQANGLIDYDKYFFEKDPEPFLFTNTPKEGMPEFKLSSIGDADDRRAIGNILQLWKTGTPIEVISTGVIGTERFSDLLARYPELNSYLGAARKYHGGTFGDARYGTRFVPNSGEWKANVTQPGVAARTATEAALLGIAKPAATGTVMERYDRPEDSEATITRDFEKLMAEKPEATRAALDWKFDPRLDAGSQLNEFERGIVNKYRAMLTEKALQGR